jgi:nitrite reductase (NADH) small subunit
VRVGDQVFAVDNFDPFSKAYVISRGIVGDKRGVPVIASPIYKHAFDLRSGRSLDDPKVQLRVWPARVRQGRVEILDE